MKIDSSVSAYTHHQREHGISRSEERAVIKNNGQQIEKERGEAQKVAENVRAQNQAITDNAVQQAETARNTNEQNNTTRENVVLKNIDTYA